MDEFGNYKIDLEMEALKSQYKDVNCYEQVQTNRIYFEYVLANEYISEMMIMYRIEKFVNNDMMEDYSKMKEGYVNSNVQQLEYIKKKFQSYITEIDNDAIKINLKNSVVVFDDIITKLKKH
jgi:hypothetical protein